MFLMRKNNNKTFILSSLLHFIMYKHKYKSYTIKYLQFYARSNFKVTKCECLFIISSPTVLR